MSGRFTESTVEEAALAWLESLGWAVKHGPDVAPEGLFAERADYNSLLPKLISSELRVPDADIDRYQHQHLIPHQRPGATQLPNQLAPPSQGGSSSAGSTWTHDQPSYETSVSPGKTKVS